MDGHGEPTKRREKLAAYFYDLSKLTFAGLVLGVFSTLVPGGELNGSAYVITSFGTLATIWMACIANNLLK